MNSEVAHISLEMSALSIIDAQFVRCGLDRHRAVQVRPEARMQLA